VGSEYTYWGFYDDSSIWHPSGPLDSYNTQFGTPFMVMDPTGYDTTYYWIYDYDDNGDPQEMIGWNEDIHGATTLEPNEWYHVAVTYDGVQMSIYINGELDASQERGPQSTDSVTPVLIGAQFTNNAPSEFFNGVLDEVALFSVALTEEQVIRGLDDKPRLAELLNEGASLVAGEEHVDTQVRLYPLGTARALAFILRGIRLEAS